MFFSTFGTFSDVYLDYYKVGKLLDSVRRTRLARSTLRPWILNINCHSANAMVIAINRRDAWIRIKYIFDKGVPKK